MSKYIWLLLLAIPPWVAVEFDAPKWVVLLSIAPFYIRASTLGEHPDEHLLGEGFAKFRKPLLIVLVLGGLILGAGLLTVVRALLH